MIYLTQEGKEKLEAKIAELLKERETESGQIYVISTTMINTYKEILSTAVILPQEKSWQNVKSFYLGDSVKTTKKYPNGVIINPNL